MNMKIRPQDIRSPSTTEVRATCISPSVKDGAAIQRYSRVVIRDRVARGLKIEVFAAFWLRQPVTRTARTVNMPPQWRFWADIRVGGGTGVDQMVASPGECSPITHIARLILANVCMFKFCSTFSWGSGNHL
jgi:hypothetical protein